MHHRLNSIPNEQRLRVAFVFSSRHFKYLCIYFYSICLLLTHTASRCWRCLFSLRFLLFILISISVREKPNTHLKTSSDSNTVTTQNCASDFKWLALSSIEYIVSLVCWRTSNVHSFHTIESFLIHSYTNRKIEWIHALSTYRRHLSNVSMFLFWLTICVTLQV